MSLLALVLGVAISAPSPVAPVGPVAEDAGWSARIAVRFVDDGGAHRAVVEATWTANDRRRGRADALDLSMAGGYPGGYGAFVRDLEGAEVVSAAEGRFRAPVRDGRASVRYVVPLDHDPDEGIGWDETPHAFSDGVLWTGRALFLTGPDADTTVVLEPPDGARVSTSLAPLDREAHAYAAEGRRLSELYLVVGRHLERTIEVEGATIVLAVDGDAAAAADVLEEQVEEHLAAVSATFGRPPPPRCLVAVTRAEREGGGSVYARDAHVLVKGAPAAIGPSDWRRTLCHELTHLWVPRVVGFDSREMWYGEGFTDYYAHLLLARSGRISGRDLLHFVGGWAGAYLDEAGAIGLREAGNLGAKNRTLIYHGGALAALRIDVALRHGSSNRRSLDDVMKEVAARCEEVGGPIDVAELDRVLGRLGGKELARFLDRHVAGAEPLPLAEVWARAGLVLEEETVRVPALDAVVPLLSTPGFTATVDGVRIDRTSAPGLEAGDFLIALAGRPVGDFGDLRHALADAGPGDELPVVVVRSGKRVEVDVRLGGHGEALPSNEEVRRRLVPAKKVGRKARTVRESLFGKRLR